MELTIDLVKIHEGIAQLMDDTVFRISESERRGGIGGPEAEWAKLLREAFLYPVAIAACLISVVAASTALLISLV